MTEQMFKIREFDLEEVVEFATEKSDFDPSSQKFWTPIERRLINDADEGDNVEVYAQLAGAADTTDIDYDLADAVVKGTIESINKALKATKSGLEIVSVDMADYTSYMLVNAKETPRQFVKRIYTK